MSLDYHDPPPLDYSSNAVTPAPHGDGYFGETGVYYDPEGIPEVDLGDSAGPPRPYRPYGGSKSPSLKLLWLLISSMVAVEEGDCGICPSHNGLYPHTTNCKCYFKCVNGVPIQKTCPPGHKFDVMSMSCTFPAHTVCAGSLLHMLPAVLNNNQQQSGNMMQQYPQQQMQQQQMQQYPQQQMQQQQMQQYPQQQMQQQQMQQFPQQQMQQQQMNGGGGSFHVTFAFPKSINKGGGMQTQGMNMMQMLKMLKMMMMNQQGTNPGMMNQNMMGQNMGQQGMNQNMMSQGMGQQGMQQNMMGQNMGKWGSNLNMMGQQGGMPQSTMSQQGGMIQNMGNQGGMNQNMMNQNMQPGGGMGSNPQCQSCAGPKKVLTINFDIKKRPIKFRLFG